VSIPANIAEGCGRGSDIDFARCLQIAAGSGSELEYLLLVARDLSLLGERCCAILVADVQEIKRMLSSLIRKLRAGN